MDAAAHARYGDELFRALRGREPVAPLTTREADITIEDAYAISLRLLSRRLDEGEQVIGKKIGVTSAVVQEMLGVRQPDFGFLTDRMRYEDGALLPISSVLIQPRAEGEIAFRLRRDLAGPGITESEVLAATECVFPCFEIVDSRIRDWKIRIQDTIADNASSGLFVLGPEASPHDVDFPGCELRVEKNGAPLSAGRGEAALGSPLTSVAWLANTLGRLGGTLRAGEVVLSGSLVPLEPVRAGDRMRLTVSGIGGASVVFG